MSSHRSAGAPIATATVSDQRCAGRRVVGLVERRLATVALVLRWFAVPCLGVAVEIEAGWRLGRSGSHSMY